MTSSDGYRFILAFRAASERRVFQLNRLNGCRLRPAANAVLRCFLYLAVSMGSEHGARLCVSGQRGLSRDWRPGAQADSGKQGVSHW